MNIHKSGTVRFWGDWFGRPFDNCHRAVKASISNKENTLVIYFDNDEKCTVYNPQSINNEKNTFYISQASKIVWEWYSCGDSHTQQNLCRRIYTLTNEKTVLLECFGKIESGCKKIKIQGHYAFEIC